jgi:Ca2+-binding EF-hand superfamily protein
MERKWLAKHGKKQFIDFDDRERSKLKQYFNSLDTDGSGHLGIAQLEEPLISLGLAESRDQVQQIIDIVDKDGSRQIEFDEFMEILKAKNVAATSMEHSGGNAAITGFFKG